MGHYMDQPHMQDNVAADAPAVDGAEPSAVEENLSPEEQNSRELDAIWERHEAGDEKPEEEVAETEDPVEEAETDEDTEEPAEEEAKEEEVKAPSDLPQSLRGVWKDLPESARAAIQEDRSELNRRLSDAGRQVQGIAPIRDVLVKAVEDMPHMANMKPQQVAEEIFSLAKISGEFNKNPVGAMMGLIQQHNMGQAVYEALTGQQQTPDSSNAVAMQREIADLKQQLSRVADPEYLREQFTGMTAEQTAINDVNSFVQQAEHWAEVEQHLPQLVPLAQQKLGDGAANAAVLKTAYNMAIDIFKPDLKAPAPAPSPADPDKAERAKAAKSINVASKTSGRARPLSEDEALDAAFERASRK